MTMTREDVLRELELLPVWQLRTPVTPTQAKVAQATELTQQVEAQEVTAPVSAPEVQQTLRLLVSEDASYLFLLAPPQSVEEETLLQNMLKAMQAKTRVDIDSQSMSDLSAYSPKIIIAMGEMASQSIGLIANIHAVRSQIHQTEFGVAIVTFSPRHLLQNLADKAMAWEDLCLAKAHIKSLP